MRAILPLLVAACPFAFASRGRGEFDAGPAKPTQASGAATFGGMASNRPAVKNPYTILYRIDVKNVAGPFVVGYAFKEPLLSTIRKHRDHRPANIPSLPYVEYGISCDYGSSISIFVPAK
jgi:hypothetical protein